MVKMVTLKSSDGATFEVEEAVALMSQTIKHMVEDGCAETAIPLPNVAGKILSKVIEYCRNHVELDGETSSSDGSSSSSSASAAMTTGELKAWDEEFVKLDRDTLFDLILAANYLDIKSLLNLTCQAVADMIKDLSVEEVRMLFNIENDFSPEEEAALREEHKWAFEV